MEISKDERDLYDRQIRLWGLEGQNRLRNSRILVLGMGAVAVELAKNLCLAGVGSLTLQSSQSVTGDDFAYNFFLDPSAMGENAATASAPQIQRLNPRVAVTTETAAIEDLNEKSLSSYDVVIVCQLLNRDRLVWVNETVRKSQCAFYYALLQGWGGFLFVDLGQPTYQFVVEKELTKETSNPGPVSATQTIISAQAPTKDSDATTTKLTVTETYTSLNSALNVSDQFGKSLKMRHRNKISPYLPAFLALLDNPANPDVGQKAEALGLPKHIVPAEFVEIFINSKDIQLSGMASVLGGTLSQEVINFLTMREYPIQNVHIYDGLEGKGPQYYLAA